MKLIFFTLFIWYPMISCLELTHIIVNNNDSVTEINDTLNKSSSYKLVVDKDELDELSENDDDDSFDVLSEIETNRSQGKVGVISIDPDGQVKCHIKNKT